MSIIQAFVHRYKFPIIHVASALGSALSSSRTTVTVPSHNIGDIVIAIGTSDSSNPPSVSTAGWTLLSQGSTTTHSSTVAYKFSQTGAQESLTFFGSGSSTRTSSSCIIFRNVSSLGSVQSSSGSGTASTHTIPSLTLSYYNNGTSTVLGLVSRPFITSTDIPGAIINSGMVYTSNVASFAGGTVSTSTSVPSIRFAIELVN